VPPFKRIAGRKERSYLTLGNKLASLLTNKKE